MKETKLTIYHNFKYKKNLMRMINKKFKRASKHIKVNIKQSLFTQKMI